jgi:hypothetical protein
VLHQRLAAAALEELAEYLRRRYERHEAADEEGHKEDGRKLVAEGDARREALGRDDLHVEVEGGEHCSGGGTAGAAEQERAARVGPRG